jgi:hypothetical protein
VSSIGNALEFVGSNGGSIPVIANSLTPFPQSETKLRLSPDVNVPGIVHPAEVTSKGSSNPVGKARMFVNKLSPVI